MGFTQYDCWDRGEPVSIERRRWTKDVVYVCLVFFAVSGSCIAQENRTMSLDTDTEALERFQAAVDPTGQRLSWVSGTNPCTWTGVQCYENRVAWLRLSGFQFTGTLPANIFVDLDQLRVLSLHHNRFTGAFPVELANCTTLHQLYLGNNLFSGPLPNFTAGMFPGLSHFDVGFNDFNGEIPASLNTLRSLAVLDLESNAFSGKLPELSANLLRFSVANNNLQGSIPVSLQKFSNSSFVGNGALCGPPTTTLCPGAPPPPNAPTAPMPTTSSEASTPMATTIPSRKRKLTVGVIAGIATSAFVVAFVFLVCLIYLFCCGCRGNDEDVENAQYVGKEMSQEYDRNGSPDGYGADGEADHFKERNAVSLPSSSNNHSKRLQFLDHDKRPEFGLEELLQASAEVLGKGSTGTSYRADLANDCVVIVKRLKDIVVDRKEFELQVEKLGRLRHRHLLPLGAYYFSRNEKLLVTDFMPRGSLHSLLHDRRSDNRIFLDWVSREKIALGAARALSYLHKPFVRTPHGNVKSSNVLLNTDYEPYLSDYGMTALFNVGASRLGGYRAPEVTDLRKTSMQSDVYSFGVLMLELMTGKMPTQAAANPKEACIDLPRWITSIHRNDWVAVAVDPELKKGSTAVEVEMAQMMQLAVACIDRIPERRPKMEEVVLLLEDITQLGQSSDSYSVCPNSIPKFSSRPDSRDSSRPDSKDSSRPNSKDSSRPDSKDFSRPDSRDSRSSGPTPPYTRPSSGVFVVGD